jgi:hypothetical protein
MSSIEDDPILGILFDTPEKKAKWIHRLKIIYIMWIFFMIIGILSILLWYISK